MRTRQKQRVVTDTWRSLGCRTTPLEHWSKRKPTVEPRWVGTYSQINDYMMVYDNPRSLRLNIFKLHFLKNTRPFEAKFHIRPPWDVGMKNCSNVTGDMTKMASMPIYGKNLQKSPFSGTKRLMTLKLVYGIGYSSIAKSVQVMTQG